MIYEKYFYLNVRYEAKLKFSFLSVCFGFTQIFYTTRTVFEDGNISANSIQVERHVR